VIDAGIRSGFPIKPVGIAITTPPIIPRPPAAVTAAASFLPATNPIGADSIGTMMPRASVSRGRSATDPVRR
jgi:hypothetical protein